MAKYFEVRLRLWTSGKQVLSVLLQQQNDDSDLNGSQVSNNAIYVPEFDGDISVLEVVEVRKAI